MHQVPSATTARYGHSLESFVVGQDRAVSSARGYPLRSRKRSHVDDHRWVEVTSSVGNTVAQNQASLGVSVVYLHLDKFGRSDSRTEEHGAQLRKLASTQTG